ncbi:MAG: family 78 glycoside hydrolase catalytic domain [Clostridia bacterium]|nr:family 78 glycoside hydrolase catalytic domain [Clostridia bacterium]
MKNAAWITYPTQNKNVVNFIRHFEIKKELISASLSVTALGIYAAYINGNRIGDFVLAPGWTSYDNRILYQTYDVTKFINHTNRITLGLAPGWAGQFGYVGNNFDVKERMATDPAIIAKLELCFADGTSDTIVTDEGWDVYSSFVKTSTIFGGETVDMTSAPEYISKAHTVCIQTKLCPHDGEIICEHERIAPVCLITTPKGEKVIDFGQNLSGYAEIRIKGKRGERIVVHHAEVLDSDGNFYTDNMRSASNENVYVLSGGEDVFKPTYTFQGFRYIRLAEYPSDKIDLNSFSAIVVHSDISRTGRFVCGNEKINQLCHNIIWGQKSNFIDVPTDCPQRDERSPWTGDAQVFARTAMINFDTSRFFEKWLRDLMAEQFSNGALWKISPSIMRVDAECKDSSAAWGDAACIVPWQHYMAYGNKEFLKEIFPLMKKWVDYVHSCGEEEYLWLGGIHFGDWLAMDAGEDFYTGATSFDFIASAYFAYSTSLLVKAGEVLGMDMNAYRTLHSNIKNKIRSYFLEDGLPKENVKDTSGFADHHDKPQTRALTQTALVLLVYFDICTDEEKPKLVQKLAELIKNAGGLMQTGFVGTPYILHTLSQNGFTSLAYDLLLCEKNPSWLYSVCHGATTMWEHWDGIKEDGSFWDDDMNSFNHYSYGAVFDWIFSVSAGITPVCGGYSRITLAPQPDRRLGFADASILTKYGTIRSHWYYKDNTVYFEFEIPEGVEAKLTLPSGFTQTLTHGNYIFSQQEDSL